MPCCWPNDAAPHALNQKMHTHREREIGHSPSRSKHKHIYTHTHTNIHTHTHSLPFIRTLSLILTIIHSRLHTHTHTYTHSQIHTHTHNTHGQVERKLPPISLLALELSLLTGLSLLSPSFHPCFDLTHRSKNVQRGVVVVMAAAS